MPTVDELLAEAGRLMREGRLPTGGLTHLYSPRRVGSLKSPPICDGCEDKKRHRCKKKVPVVWVATIGDHKRVKRGFVKCACAKCNPPGKRRKK